MKTHLMNKPLSTLFSVNVSALVLLLALLLLLNPAAFYQAQAQTQEGHDHAAHEQGHDEAEAGHDHKEVKAGYDEAEAGHEHEEIRAGHDDDKPEAEHKHEHEHEAQSEGTELSAKQMQLANIKVTTLTPQTMDYQIYAPGELKANGYSSYFVSPRVDSVVLRRHVALGEHVVQGTPLVTLFSESMVDAQAVYSIASAEWLRVKKLGKKAVGAKRFVTAQTDAKAAYGRLIAYGLTDKAITRLLKADAPLGEYVLNAAIAGVVLSDDFHQGQRVPAGGALMELADESQLWVEASFAANMHLALPVGTRAVVKVGHDAVAAEVIQEAHTIDRETRTRVVRLLIDNLDDHLHSGMFADVFFTFKTTEPVLALPENALMRSSDGDWTVFIEQTPGHFKAQEVTLGRSLGKWRVIEGVKPGSRVVSEGAFFVASQLAKGGFDPHNH